MTDEERIEDLEGLVEELWSKLDAIAAVVNGELTGEVVVSVV
ncbi:MAG: hypothetical protein ACR2L3_03675 [Actinomycetota bacterium]